MYQQIGILAYKPNLNNTISICKLLGNPEKNIQSIHIAGTNGKGSVSHMLTSILQCAGYKVGLYTSPHLKDFRERIKVNGKMISKNYVVEFVEKYKKDFEKIQPSFFEWTMGLAFDYFKNTNVDIAIIETGLGGRLDSANIISPLLSIITNISYDHQNILGDTLVKIAHEKAGIIKKNKIVIIGEKQKEIEVVFREKAKKENALLLYAADFAGDVGSIDCELKGVYQRKNIRSVLVASEILRQFKFSIDSKAIAKGLKYVVQLTGLRGRWELISKNPLVIADIAHNEAGIKEVVKQIRSTPHKKTHIVFGVVNDKAITNILRLLPKNAIYYFCKANITRAMSETLLADSASRNKLIGKTYLSVIKALNAARKNAKQNDMIIITGSAFVVAEVI